MAVYIFDASVIFDIILIILANSRVAKRGRRAELFLCLLVYLICSIIIIIYNGQGDVVSI